MQVSTTFTSYQKTVTCGVCALSVMLKVWCERWWYKEQKQKKKDMAHIKAKEKIFFFIFILESWAFLRNLQGTFIEVDLGRLGLVLGFREIRQVLG